MPNGQCEQRHAKEQQRMADIKKRIANHPCFCAKAHGKYARIHLPVAPACNVQCNYCNRKYDCSNESRPGVTSRVITPQQALERVKLVQEKLPTLSVVGIAGPGDGLANPDATLRTFELIREHDPNLKLCLSTNGLMLPRYAADLVRLGVEHLTVTMNAIDPAISASIYKWVALDGKRYYGEEGASLLLERQLEGIGRTVELEGIVKVNTVLIPEINGTHILEVSKKIRELGVFIHNIVPLICKPEHGTYFGEIGLREPDTAELDQAREAGTAVMGSFSRVMKHCKQCRADAVGLLGQDLELNFQEVGQ
ncbi:nitrogenase cofactor biosynthesis protein NifB [Desulfurispirillum indicum]|uniref:Radical SAM domain protein n=1 Tax=Desulfurispirillum indicum (strain ATCC BAA-1389 / DSM 22839 / S5) TaxID=653733 RepID=E6W2X1_DESIS|nr:nitrogenase cofactor biosynthesis protein NifB [Desulfurispirillum indicum]ADU66796.1 Radical SAM domain protein [Desulfurispirillum indicum S5]UCZ56115.1 nitrogenase cofactor biosynthesis protein NifB [Desulfurispirillum indicum]